MSQRWLARTLIALLLPSSALAGAGCTLPNSATAPEPGVGEGEGDPGKADDSSGSAGAEPLNQAAGGLIVYEVQARSANACVAASGGPQCGSGAVPEFPYYGQGCSILPELRAVVKSTLDDLTATGRSPGRTSGVTLQYIDEVVGANAVWLMPIFPENYRYSLPDACDDLGSPYAVRDYYHVSGSLSDRCIRAGRDEWSDTPCWGDDALRRLVEQAHGRGMKVMLDVAFNHLGHEYDYYDYAGARPLRSWIESGAELWDFDATYDDALLWPEILDEPSELPAEAPGVLQQLCGSRELPGPEAVRRYLMWREGFDDERAAMSCDRPATLENQLPGFYLGADGNNPSHGVGDNYTNNWVDVKFLFNNEQNLAHQWEFYRTRELAFRVLNYYLAQGVDAFRLDHADGLTENEWRYVFRKARHYQQFRGYPTPIFLSESFYGIEELNRVFDALTEGYHHDISYGRRWTTDLEYLLFDNRQRYIKDLSFVLLNLETHDEGRLLRPVTGFDIWRGATFYALAAASRGMLMIQAGQEWGESYDLGFRRSDYLRGRFPAEPSYDARGDQLTALYAKIHRARLDPANVALRQGKYYFPRTDRGEAKQQLFAMVKYMPDCSNTLFTFERLWVDDVAATYAVTPELASRICLDDASSYRLVDVFTGRSVWEQSAPGGRTGRHLREFGLYVHLDLGTSFQWLRLERI